MLIAIDYDDTWSADPEMWNEIVRIMEHAGHSVIIATSRRHWSDDMERGRIPSHLTIVYCGNNFKEHEVELQTGCVVDIWIDDMPGMIQQCLILNDNLD